MNTRPTLERSLRAVGPLLARDWRDAADCTSADPEIFFPEKGRIDQAAAARRICAGCPVKTECLEFALENDEEWGVWGGLSERERRRLKSGGVVPLRRCRAGLHVMSDANRSTDGRCRACRNASDRLARSRKAMAA